MLKCESFENDCFYYSIRLINFEYQKSKEEILTKESEMKSYLSGQIDMRKRRITLPNFFSLCSLVRIFTLLYTGMIVCKDVQSLSVFLCLRMF